MTMITTDREEFLNDLIGRPWIRNARGPEAYDCYYLTALAQDKVFGRKFPELEIPNDPSFRWIARAIEEQQRLLFKDWKEIEQRAMEDGALVLMGSSHRVAHLGTYFKPERSILHVDRPDGVMFHDLVTLGQYGWHKMKFYQPV